MALDSYLFEKSCYVPDGLARVAEDLRLVPAGSPAAREIAAYLNVALRHGLMTCCAVSGAEFEAKWVADLSRKGSSAWKRTVKPALEEQIFGPDERAENIKASHLPRDHAPGAEPRELDVAELIARATKSLAAHLDLTEILRKHRCHDLKVGRSLCEADLAPLDCEVLAKISLRRRKVEDALSWVERGLELEEKDHRPNRTAWGLQDLERQILRKLDRGEDALTSSWNAYLRSPSVHAYKDLMKYVPKGERSEWHAKAMARLEGADLSDSLALLSHTKERDRLAQLVDATSREKLARISHYFTEPAARSLSKSHPVLAAKLNVAMALRILAAKKSKYYDASIDNLEKARKILLKEGRKADWERIAAEIREKHRRKTGFLSAFERLLAGQTAREPSFIDRAKDRWARGVSGRQGKT